MSKHALIRYWTGTGNTARAVGILAAFLRESGWTVDAALARFDSPVPDSSALARADLLVVACPTLGFSAPSHFLRWLRHLPRVAQGHAAVMAVCGATEGRRGIIAGHPGVLLGQVAGLLLRRGFQIISTSAHSYPENWTQMLEPPDAEVCARSYAAADAGVRALAQELAREGGQSYRVGAVAAALLSPVAGVFRLLGRRFLGKLLVADPTCTACGSCARGCPAGAIRMRRGRPSWSLDCDACNRCINLCPSRSIQVSLARVLVHGVGNLALAGWVIAGASVWGWPAALALFVAGSAIQLTVVDFLWRWLERVPALAPALSWGWTKTWRRYQAPRATFVPGGPP